jgi:hypothetical protein
MINFFIVFLLRGVRRRLSQPEANPKARRNLLTSENGIMKPIFCLFDIFIPFLVRTSMFSSQPRSGVVHKAVMMGNCGESAFGIA